MFNFNVSYIEVLNYPTDLSTMRKHEHVAYEQYLRG